MLASRRVSYPWRYNVVPADGLLGCSTNGDGTSGPQDDISASSCAGIQRGTRSDNIRSYAHRSRNAGDQESHYAGVYFYSSLAPRIGNVIRDHAKHPEIVEYEIDDAPLVEAKSNADRNGYFLYQSDNGKMVL